MEKKTWQLDLLDNYSTQGSDSSTGVNYWVGNKGELYRMPLNGVGYLSLDDGLSNKSLEVPKKLDINLGEGWTPLRDTISVVSLEKLMSYSEFVKKNNNGNGNLSNPVARKLYTSMYFGGKHLQEKLTFPLETHVEIVTIHPEQGHLMKAGYKLDEISPEFLRKARAEGYSVNTTMQNISID